MSSSGYVPPTTGVHPAQANEKARQKADQGRERAHGILEQLRAVWQLGGLSVRELGRRVLAEVQDDDSLGQAAQLAYYFLLCQFS